MYITYNIPVFVLATSNNVSPPAHSVGALVQLPGELLCNIKRRLCWFVYLSKYVSRYRHFYNIYFYSSFLFACVDLGIVIHSYMLQVARFTFSNNDNCLWFHKEMMQHFA